MIFLRVTLRVLLCLYRQCNVRRLPFAATVGTSVSRLYDGESCDRPDRVGEDWSLLAATRVECVSLRAAMRGQEPCAGAVVRALVLVRDISSSAVSMCLLLRSVSALASARRKAGYIASQSNPSLTTTQTHRSPPFIAGQALLSLLKGSKPELTVGGSGSQTTEDAVGITFSGLIRAHCRRQDVTSALTEVAEMEAAGGEPSSEILLYLLDACAIARPPLLRELETVWARIEVSAAGPFFTSSSLKGLCTLRAATTKVVYWYFLGQVQSSYVLLTANGLQQSTAVTDCLIRKLWTREWGLQMIGNGKWEMAPSDKGFIENPVSPLLVLFLFLPWPQELGLTTTLDVGQDHFVARMAAHANGAGYAPLGQSQEDWQQVGDVRDVRSCYLGVLRTYKAFGISFPPKHNQQQ